MLLQSLTCKWGKETKTANRPSWPFDLPIWVWLKKLNGRGKPQVLGHVLPIGFFSVRLITGKKIKKSAIAGVRGLEAGQLVK